MNLAVIGSTGSIGKTTLKVAKAQGHRVRALAAYSDLAALKTQFDEFKPDYVGVIDSTKYAEAREIFGDKLICGDEALIFFANMDVLPVISVVGLNGLKSVAAAVEKKQTIALANKESVVAGGDLLTKADEFKYIRPIDSEHSAVWQCLNGENKRQVKRIILTASGGAYYDKTPEELAEIKPSDIYHPNWKMGRKITIDSSTMMNKTLEIVEARYLFDCKAVDYAIHPQSIIHSMVEFTDGAVMAQLAQPDMGLPISYAINYPDRKPCDFIGGLDLLSCNISFKPKREEVFFAPSLARYVIERGKSSGAVLNAADEAAVKLYTEGKILFSDIAKIVKNALFMSDIVPINSVQEVFDVHNDTVRRVNIDYKRLSEDI